MKKLKRKFLSSLFMSTFLFSPLTTFAGEVSTATSDLGYFVSSENTGSETQVHLYKLGSDGAASVIISNIFPDSTTNSFSATDYTVDQQKGKIYFLEPPRSGISQRRIRVFDMDTNAFEGFTNITNLPGSGSPMFIDIPVKMENLADKKCNTTSASCGATDTKFMSLGGSGTDELIRVEEDGISTGGTNGKTLVKTNADGSVQIGADGNDVDITTEGLSIGGDPVISKKSNGELHIGKNSWITKEEGGRQKVYAKDANGNPIPIDYTNGTKLLINGRDVEQSINNVGALSAALTGLPTVPTDTTLACGFGTGTHGGDFAFAGGCASKVNDSLSVNYAASMTMPGQEYAGDFEDTISARAGFVWKLGKPVKPTLISMKEKKEFQTQISSLEEKNKQLLARLERLEKVALGSVQSNDLASNQIDFNSLNKDLKTNHLKNNM
tara:strand:- start:724 stop:2040 length:1317 start_codon:yes stop_codon:yes gene_type:complete